MGIHLFNVASEHFWVCSDPEVTASLGEDSLEASDGLRSGKLITSEARDNLL